MNTRRASPGLDRVLLVVGVWTIIGVITAVLRLLLMPRLPMGETGFIALNVAFALFWVPVTLVVAGVAGRHPPPNARQRSNTVALVTVCALALALDPLWIQMLVRGAGGHTAPYPARLLGGLDTNIVYYVAVVAVVLAARSYRASLSAEMATARLESALAEAHVQVLTMQLQPHFLFNTLHLVSEEMFRDAAAAKRTLSDLRRLLTESFSYAARREVTLGEELSFLDAYVAIQDRRFRGRLSVSFAVAPDVRDAMVPHLLLQPLVENAIRHGIAPRAGPGHVRVGIERDMDVLSVIVQDDGVGLAAEPPRLPRGLGVTQTRARLRHLYGDRGSLTVAACDGGGVRTVVNIPFHTTPLEAVDTSTAADAPPIPTPGVCVRTWSSARKVLTVIVAWVIAAVLWSQLVSVSVSPSDGPPAGWFALLDGHLIIAATGALMSWPAFLLIRALPLNPRRIGTNAVAHLGAGVALAGVHAAIALRVFAMCAPITGWAARAAATYRGSLVGWMMWDVLAYLAVVAFLNRLKFVQWHRDTMLEAERLRITVATARVELVQLQLQPAVLLSGLDSVARAANEGAQRCELVIERFGDVLRRMLAGTPVGVDDMQRALEHSA